MDLLAAPWRAIQLARDTEPVVDRMGRKDGHTASASDTTTLQGDIQSLALNLLHHHHKYTYRRCRRQMWVVTPERDHRCDSENNNNINVNNNNINVNPCTGNEPTEAAEMADEEPSFQPACSSDDTDALPVATCAGRGRPTQWIPSVNRPSDEQGGNDNEIQNEAKNTQPPPQCQRATNYLAPSSSSASSSLLQNILRRFWGPLLGSAALHGLGLAATVTAVFFFSHFLTWLFDYTTTTYAAHLKIYIQFQQSQQSVIPTTTSNASITPNHTSSTTTDPMPLHGASSEGILYAVLVGVLLLVSVVCEGCAAAMALRVMVRLQRALSAMVCEALHAAPTAVLEYNHRPHVLEPLEGLSAPASSSLSPPTAVAPPSLGPREARRLLDTALPQLLEIGGKRLHLFWSTPLLAIGATYLLAQWVSWAGAVVLFLILFSYTFLIPAVLHEGKVADEVKRRADVRIRAVATVLEHMAVLRANGWLSALLSDSSSTTSSYSPAAVASSSSSSCSSSVTSVTAARRAEEDTLKRQTTAKTMIVWASNLNSFLVECSFITIVFYTPSLFSAYFTAGSIFPANVLCGYLRSAVTYMPLSLLNLRNGLRHIKDCEDLLKALAAGGEATGEMIEWTAGSRVADAATISRGSSGTATSSSSSMTKMSAISATATAQYEPFPTDAEAVTQYMCESGHSRVPGPVSTPRAAGGKDCAGTWCFALPLTPPQPHLQPQQQKQRLLFLPRHAIIAVTGPTGCGKSALLKLLAGEDVSHYFSLYRQEMNEKTARPAATTMCSGGSSTGRSHSSQRRDDSSLPGGTSNNGGGILRAGRTVYVAQDGFVFDGTIAENITAATAGVSECKDDGAAGEGGQQTTNKTNNTDDDNHHRVAALMTICGMDMDKFSPTSLVSTTSLSGGERLRISLARALFSSAETVLLDEPVSALDPDIAEDFIADVLGPLRALRLKTFIIATNHPRITGTAPTPTTTATVHMTPVEEEEVAVNGVIKGSSCSSRSSSGGIADYCLDVGRRPFALVETSGSHTSLPAPTRSGPTTPTAHERGEEEDEEEEGDGDMTPIVFPTFAAAVATENGPRTRTTFSEAAPSPTPRGQTPTPSLVATPPVNAAAASIVSSFSSSSPIPPSPPPPLALEHEPSLSSVEQLLLRRRRVSKQRLVNNINISGSPDQCSGDFTRGGGSRRVSVFSSASFLFPLTSDSNNNNNNNNNNTTEETTSNEQTKKKFLPLSYPPTCGTSNRPGYYGSPVLTDSLCTPTPTASAPTAVVALPFECNAESRTSSIVRNSRHCLFEEDVKAVEAAVAVAKEEDAHDNTRTENRGDREQESHRTHVCEIIPNVHAPATSNALPCSSPPHAAHILPSSDLVIGARFLVASAPWHLLAALLIFSAWRVTAYGSERALADTFARNPLLGQFDHLTQRETYAVRLVCSTATLFLFMALCVPVGIAVGRFQHAVFEHLLTSTRAASYATHAALMRSGRLPAAMRAGVAAVDTIIFPLTLVLVYGFLFVFYAFIVIYALPLAAVGVGLLTVCCALLTAAYLRISETLHKRQSRLQDATGRLRQLVTERALDVRCHDLSPFSRERLIAAERRTLRTALVAGCWARWTEMVMDATVAIFCGGFCLYAALDTIETAHVQKEGLLAAASSFSTTTGSSSSSSSVLPPPSPFDRLSRLFTACFAAMALKVVVSPLAFEATTLIHAIRRVGSAIRTAMDLRRAPEPFESNAAAVDARNSSKSEPASSLAACPATNTKMFVHPRGVLRASNLWLRYENVSASQPASHRNENDNNNGSRHSVVSPSSVPCVPQPFVLRGLTLPPIPLGTMTLLRGPSGCGKSSLFLALLGLYPLHQPPPMPPSDQTEQGQEHSDHDPFTSPGLGDHDHDCPRPCPPPVDEPRVSLEFVTTPAGAGGGDIGGSNINTGAALPSTPTHATTLADPHWRRLLLWVPQEAFLVPGTVLDNILFPLAMLCPHDYPSASTFNPSTSTRHSMEVEEQPQGEEPQGPRPYRVLCRSLLDDLGLHRLRLDDPVHARGANLSGGERQCLGIARALATLILQSEQLEEGEEEDDKEPPLSPPPHPEDHHDDQLPSPPQTTNQHHRNQSTKNNHRCSTSRNAADGKHKHTSNNCNKIGYQQQGHQQGHQHHHKRFVVLMDEPTSFLAPDACRRVLRVTRRVACEEHGAAVLVISHQNDDALAVVDLCVTLDHGAVMHTQHKQQKAE